MQSQRLGVGSSGGGDNIRHYFISEAKEILNELRKKTRTLKGLIYLGEIEEVLDVKFIKVLQIN